MQNCVIFIFSLEIALHVKETYTLKVGSFDVVVKI